MSKHRKIISKRSKDSKIIRIENENGKIKGYEILFLHNRYSSYSELFGVDDLFDDAECKKRIESYRWRLELEAEQKLNRFEKLIGETRLDCVVRSKFKEMKDK